MHFDIFEIHISLLLKRDQRLKPPSDVRQIRGRKYHFPQSFIETCCAHHENTVTNFLVFLGGNRYKHGCD